MTRSQLTQGLLKSILHYNPDTGVFTWLVDFKNGIKSGDRAGSRRWDGYIEIRFKGLHSLAHRLAWLYVHGTCPYKLDHKDRNPSNNRLDNIRICSSSQNTANKKMCKNNTSGYKGVWQVKNKGKGTKWRCAIEVDTERIYLGSFDTKEEAAKRYNEVAIHYFKEFAKLNVI